MFAGGKPLSPRKSKLLYVTIPVNLQMLHEKQTGNRWSQRNNFKKVANKMYPMDLDYGQDNAELSKKLEVESSKSKLDKAIKELVTMIFDIESMKKAMVEFEVNICGKQKLNRLNHFGMKYYLEYFCSRLT